MESKHDVIVMVPVVPLGPILGGLGVLPELCAIIQAYATMYTMRQIVEVAAQYTDNLSWGCRIVHWGPQHMGGAVYDVGINRVCLGPRAAFGPLLEQTITRVFDIETHFGPRGPLKTGDDWIVEHDGTVRRETYGGHTVPCLVSGLDTVGAKCGLIMDSSEWLASMDSSYDDSDDEY